MEPWYRTDPLRFAAAALVAGLLLGGIVTLRAGQDVVDPERDPGALARRGARQRPGSCEADRDPDRRAQGRRQAGQAHEAQADADGRRARDSGPDATATATPDDEENGADTPAATPAPVRAAPRKAPQQVAGNRKPTITPQRKTTKPPASTPAPARTPAPAPTSAPAPASTPAPTAAPTRPGPNRPPGGGGGGDDDDPGNPGG